MRHRRKGKILGRKIGPRRALMKSLANSLILNGRIITTETKAKALRPIIEKQVTRAKTKTLASRRKLLKFLNEKAVNKLLNELGPFYQKRKGGYTRIMKIGRRQGDNADIALIEFVDYKKKETENRDEIQTKSKAKKTKPEEKK